MRGGVQRLAALAIVLSSVLVPVAAHALRDDVFTSETQPANTLLVPFDVTDGIQTYIQVSNPYGVSSSSVPKITTHWAFWSDSCTHLFDTNICLTLQDTIVVDPRSVSAVDEGNQPVGPVADLSGERGFVTVTAYATDDTCAGPEVLGFQLVDDAIVGLFTLANDATDAAAGLDAIGLGLDETGRFVDLPDFLLSPSAGDGFLDVQTLPIPDLEVAQVIYLAVAENTGKLAGEIGPIGRNVTASATFIDTLEIPLSLPSVSIGCARFASLHSGGDDPLIPPTVTIDTSGIFRLTNIHAGADPVGDADGQDGNDTWLYGVYAQQLGPFGTGSRAKYPVIFSDGQPTPTPRPTATPTPAATSTPGPTATQGATPTPAPTGGATPTPTPVPTPTSGVEPPACEQAVVTVTVNYSSSNVAGINVILRYQDSVSMPGFGTEPAVVDRVENLTGVTGGLFGVGDEDEDPNNRRLNIGLVSVGSPIPSGEYARATFDCEAGTPVLADFQCTSDVSNSLGGVVSSTCTLGLATE
jgi:hypothetical protein